MARAMKFVSQQWKDGQWRAIELPGATDLDQWEQSWKIFRTGCIMLGIATAAVLDRYSAEFKQRVSDHPGVWHLAAQADIRCRSECWQQELRRQQSFHQTHPQMSSFVPEMPPGHHHEPLQGFTLDYTGNHGVEDFACRRVSQGLCEELAKAYEKWVTEHPRRDPEWELRLTEEQRGADLWSKKRTVEDESEECIGGLRNPSASVQKVPGLVPIGQMLNEGTGRVGERS